MKKIILNIFANNKILFLIIMLNNLALCYLFSQTLQDTFYVKTLYEQILKDGRLSYIKVPVWQKTYDKNYILRREVLYNTDSKQLDKEKYFYYDKTNHLYLIEIYNDKNILIEYSRLKYKKNKLSKIETYNSSNNKISYEKSFKKRNIEYLQKYNNQSILVYEHIERKTDTIIISEEKYFTEEDTIKTRLAIEYYGNSGRIIRSTQIVNYVNNIIDTINIDFDYINDRLTKKISVSNNDKIVTTYEYYPKGSIRRYYSINRLKKYTEYFEYDLRTYFREIPYKKPQH